MGSVYWKYDDFRTCVRGTMKLLGTCFGCFQCIFTLTWLKNHYWLQIIFYTFLPVSKVCIIICVILGGTYIVLWLKFNRNQKWLEFLNSRWCISDPLPTTSTSHHRLPYHHLPSYLNPLTHTTSPLTVPPTWLIMPNLSSAHLDPTTSLLHCAKSAFHLGQAMVHSHPPILPTLRLNTTKPHHLPHQTAPWNISLWPCVVSDSLDNGQNKCYHRKHPNNFRSNWND